MDPVLIVCLTGQVPTYLIGNDAKRLTQLGLPALVPNISGKMVDLSKDSCRGVSCRKKWSTGSGAD